MYYPPKPVTEYIVDGWKGPAGPFKDTPAFWNLAWLMLPNVEGDPALWKHNPIQDDIVAHVWPELYTSALEDYPLVTARMVLDVEAHPIMTNWLPATPDLMIQRARSADARLRAGQSVANLIKVDFVQRRKV
jgi:hypothetical protein